MKRVQPVAPTRIAKVEHAGASRLRLQLMQEIADTNRQMDENHVEEQQKLIQKETEGRENVQEDGRWVLSRLLDVHMCALEDMLYPLRLQCEDDAVLGGNKIKVEEHAEWGRIDREVALERREVGVLPMQRQWRCYKARREVQHLRTDAGSRAGLYAAAIRGGESMMDEELACRVGVEEGCGRGCVVLLELEGRVAMQAESTDNHRQVCNSTHLGAFLAVERSERSRVLRGETDQRHDIYDLAMQVRGVVYCEDGEEKRRNLLMNEERRTRIGLYFEGWMLGTRWTESRTREDIQELESQERLEVVAAKKDNGLQQQEGKYRRYVEEEEEDCRVVVASKRLDSLQIVQANVIQRGWRSSHSRRRANRLRRFREEELMIQEEEDRKYVYPIMLHQIEQDNEKETNVLLMDESKARSILQISYLDYVIVMIPPMETGVRKHIEKRALDLQELYDVYQRQTVTATRLDEVGRRLEVVSEWVDEYLLLMNSGEENRRGVIIQEAAAGHERLLWGHLEERGAVKERQRIRAETPPPSSMVMGHPEGMMLKAVPPSTSVTQSPEEVAATQKRMKIRRDVQQREDRWDLEQQELALRSCLVDNQRQEFTYFKKLMRQFQNKMHYRFAVSAEESVGRSAVEAQEYDVRLGIATREGVARLKAAHAEVISMNQSERDNVGDEEEQGRQEVEGEWSDERLELERECKDAVLAVYIRGLENASVSDDGLENDEEGEANGGSSEEQEEEEEEEEGEEYEEEEEEHPVTRRVDDLLLNTSVGSMPTEGDMIDYDGDESDVPSPISVAVPVTTPRGNQMYRGMKKAAGPSSEEGTESPVPSDIPTDEETCHHNAIAATQRTPAPPPVYFAVPPPKKHRVVTPPDSSGSHPRTENVSQGGGMGLLPTDDEDGRESIVFPSSSEAEVEHGVEKVEPPPAGSITQASHPGIDNTSQGGGMGFEEDDDGGESIVFPSSSEAEIEHGFEKVEPPPPPAESVTQAPSPPRAAVDYRHELLLIQVDEAQRREQIMEDEIGASTSLDILADQDLMDVQCIITQRELTRQHELECQRAARQRELKQYEYECKRIAKQEEAATCIQSSWRGHEARKRTKALKLTRQAEKEARQYEVDQNATVESVHVDRTEEYDGDQSSIVGVSSDTGSPPSSTRNRDIPLNYETSSAPTAADAFIPVVTPPPTSRTPTPPPPRTDAVRPSSRQKTTLTKTPHPVIPTWDEEDDLDCNINPNPHKSEAINSPNIPVVDTTKTESPNQTEVNFSVDEEDLNDELQATQMTEGDGRAHIQEDELESRIGVERVAKRHLVKTHKLARQREAATTIQAGWRGYGARRYTQGLKARQDKEEEEDDNEEGKNTDWQLAVALQERFGQRWVGDQEADVVREIYDKLPDGMRKQFVVEEKPDMSASQDLLGDVTTDDDTSVNASVEAVSMAGWVQRQVPQIPHREPWQNPPCR